MARRQRNIRYYDPGVTKFSPDPLKVRKQMEGKPAVVVKESRQLRRKRQREEGK